MSDDAPRQEFRDTLPDEADNYDVFCERCQRVHKYYTYTKQDHDRVISEGAKNLSDAIDADIAARVFADIFPKES